MALDDGDQPVEARGDPLHELLGARAPLRLQALRERGEARDVDGDERTVEHAVAWASRVEALPLPAADDLPVVVAARMSLSFPLVISAVPLWAFDRTLRRNNEALAVGAPPSVNAVPERVWFSDGGVSSNFPVHFFDAPLPSRPTFVIDLDGFHPDYPKQADESKNVYLPPSSVGGVLERWHRFPEEPGLGRLSAFVSAIVRTMQNRVDTALARQPGYRDRIVHVHTDADEGGMNLTMPPRVIEALTLRGREAARQLVGRFAETPGTDPRLLSWDSHRWTRYRATLAAIGDQLEALADAWATEPPPGERSYEQLAARGSDQGPSAYRFANAAQRELALEVTHRLVEAGELLAAADGSLEPQAPRPPSVARVVPRE